MHKRSAVLLNTVLWFVGYLLSSFVFVVPSGTVLGESKTLHATRLEQTSPIVCDVLSSEHIRKWTTTLAWACSAYEK